MPFASMHGFVYLRVFDPAAMNQLANLQAAVDLAI